MKNKFNFKIVGSGPTGLLLSIALSDNYNIFITSDNKYIYSEVCKVFDKDKIIYDDNKIMHLDKYNTGIKEKEKQIELMKLFSDHYILSQKTKRLYFSMNSNFGRLAMLFSLHDETYSIKTLDKISKKEFMGIPKRQTSISDNKQTSFG